MVLAKDEMEELPSDYSDDEEVDEKTKSKRHKTLLKDIGVKIGKKRKSTRNEAAREVSEFTWSSGTGGKNKLELHDLVGSLESSKQPVVALKKKLRKMENTTKVLDKPLTKPETQRIERTVAYQDSATHMSKWNPTVQKNREAEQLQFPMNQYIPPPVTTTSLVNNFKPRNDLEREIQAVLKGSQHLLERQDKELTEAEEAALKTFDLEEALQRRKELQKARALQSYYEAKCRRQKKIKSKKYHRIMKKERQKAISKVDLETLSKENPELFQKELEKAEKMRALERASLRHRNTSKWAKNMILKGAKKTKEDEENIREQIRLSRQLTEHKTIGESDDDDDETKKTKNEDENAKVRLLETDASVDNPWLLGGKDKKSDDDENKDTTSEYRKLKSIVTKESALFQKDDETNMDDDKSVSSGDEWSKATETNTAKKQTKKLTKKTRKRRKKKTTGNQEPTTENKEPVAEDIEIEEKNASDLESDQEYEGVDKLDNPETENSNNTKETVDKRDNKKLNSTKKVVNKTGKQKSQQSADTIRYLSEDKGTAELYNDSDDEDSDDDIYDTEQRMNIREAFANDDVIADFIQEKEELIEKSIPKPEDLTLPGWGEWAGAGLNVSKKKKKAFTKEPEARKSRADDGKANVIINEVRNKKLAKLQVSELPFPYSSQTEFERSIRQPIGEQWNTPSVHGKMIEPRIRTLPGMIIDPLKPSKRMKKKLNKKD